jgi:subtilisin family serine protease
VGVTIENRFAMTSEDYADIVIDYDYNPRFLEEYQDAILHIMNDTYAILHLPLTSDVNTLIKEFGYTSIPKVFGLTSEISIDASRVENVRNLPNFNLTGKGVLIGIIDTGIDYLHPAFRNADGTTKIASIWDQSIDSETAYPSNIFFGTEYLSDQINQALISENPLEIVPSTDINGHGTMMAGVAVGMDNPQAGFQGVAPDSELVVVKLKQAKRFLRELFLIPEDVDAYQENDIMWGLQYCDLVARRMNRPIVICLGLGTSQTSHSGVTNLSNMMSIIASISGFAAVTSVGNEGSLRRHFFNTIEPEVGSTLAELNIGEVDKNFSVEIWGSFPNIYTLEITSPGGEFVSSGTPGFEESRVITFIFEATVIYFDVQIANTLSGDQLFLLRFRNATPGIWRFTISTQGVLSPGAHIWLPMGNFISDTTYFINPDIYTTVLEPATSYVPISVTAYNPLNEGLYVNASRGYTKTGAVKPELAAPGVNYVAPALNGEYISYTGTGVAAAHTAGVVALIFEWAIVRKNDVRIDTIVVKNYLIRGAKRDQNIVYPNRDWGYGILDVFNVFNVFRT